MSVSCSQCKNDWIQAFSTSKDGDSMKDRVTVLSKSILFYSIVCVYVCVWKREHLCIFYIEHHTILASIPVPPLAGIDKLLLIVVPRLTLKHSMVSIAFEKRPNHTKAFLLRVLRNNNTHYTYISNWIANIRSIDSVFMSACVAPFSSFNDNTLFSCASMWMYFVGICW